MTNARPSSALYFSQLMLDYLATPASIAAGVPDEATLPKIVLDSGALQAVPGLVITGKDEPTSGQVKKVVQVVFALLYHNRAVGVDAATDEQSQSRSIPVMEAAQMHDLISSRLSDKKAVLAYLAARDLASQGVALMHYRRLPDPELRREEKPVQRHALLSAVEIHAVWLPQKKSLV